MFTCCEHCVGSESSRITAAIAATKPSRCRDHNRFVQFKCWLLPHASYTRNSHAHCWDKFNAVVVVTLSLYISISSPYSYTYKSTDAHSATNSFAYLYDSLSTIALILYRNYSKRIPLLPPINAHLKTEWPVAYNNRVSMFCVLRSYFTMCALNHWHLNYL